MVTHIGTELGDVSDEMGASGASFSLMKQNKSKLRSSISSVHLHNMMQIGI